MCASVSSLLSLSLPPNRASRPYWSELVSLCPWCDFSWPTTVCWESPDSSLHLLLLPNQEYTIHAICFSSPMYHMLMQCQSPASSFAHCRCVPHDWLEMTCRGHLGATMTMWAKAARLLTHTHSGSLHLVCHHLLTLMSFQTCMTFLHQCHHKSSPYESE